VSFTSPSTIAKREPKRFAASTAAGIVSSPTAALHPPRAPPGDAACAASPAIAHRMMLAVLATAMLG